MAEPVAAYRRPAVPSLGATLELLEADHLVSADVGLRLRRRLVRHAARRALDLHRGRHPAHRSARLRHQPGRQRLVRPPCRCHQRAAPRHSVRPHAGQLGPLCRHRQHAPFHPGRVLHGALGLPRRAGRSGARLGLQRAALPPEAQWLVRPGRLRPLLRGPALVHRRRRRHGRLSRLADRHRWRCSTASARMAS